MFMIYSLCKGKTYRALFFVFCPIGFVPNDIDSLVNVCACPVHKGQCEGKSNKDCDNNFHFVAAESYPCKDFRKASLGS